MVFVNVMVNEKGQIVIPKVFRDAYGIEPGSEILVGEKNNALVIERKMTKTEWVAFLHSFPKSNIGKINSNADYAEELDNR
ncbi:MAG: AbrB/MazE/SpoVT family DNA-binding domain-containing protein [Candidatus Micrarchaeota archaeon]